MDREAHLGITIRLSDIIDAPTTVSCEYGQLLQKSAIRKFTIVWSFHIVPRRASAASRKNATSAYRHIAAGQKHVEA